MNTYTNEEIVSQVVKIWEDVKNERKDLWYGLVSDDEITIEDNSPEKVVIRMAKMYDAPSLSLAHLKRLSEFFGTDNINDNGKISEAGCETCDYGSCYGFSLLIQP